LVTMEAIRTSQTTLEHLNAAAEEVQISTEAAWPPGRGHQQRVCVELADE
jgi:hypothetical protein